MKIVEQENHRAYNDTIVVGRLKLPASAINNSSDIAERGVREKTRQRHFFLFESTFPPKRIITTPPGSDIYTRLA